MLGWFQSALGSAPITLFSSSLCAVSLLLPLLALSALVLLTEPTFYQSRNATLYLLISSNLKHTFVNSAFTDLFSIFPNLSILSIFYLDPK